MTEQTKCHYCSLPVTYNREDGPTTTVRTVVMKVEVPSNAAVVDVLAGLQDDAVALRLTAIEDCAIEAEARAWTGELTIQDLRNQCKNGNVSNYYCNLLTALKSLEQEDDVAAETKQKVFIYSATEVANCSLKFYWKQKLEPFGLARYGPILLKKVSFVRCCVDNLAEMLVTINQQQAVIRQRRSEIRQLCSENATLLNMLNSMSTEKQQHEKQLLEKFVCILNEKKKRFQSQQNVNAEESLPLVKHKSTVNNSVEGTKSAKRSLNCKKTSSAKRKTKIIEQSLSFGSKKVNEIMETNNAAVGDVIDTYELDTQIDSPESSPKVDQLSGSKEANEIIETEKAANGDVINPYELDTQIFSPESSLGLKYKRSVNVGAIKAYEKMETDKAADADVVDPYELDTQIDSPESPVLLGRDAFDCGNVEREHPYRPVMDDDEKSITVSATIVDDGRCTAAVCSTSNGERSATARGGQSTTMVENQNARSNDVHQENNKASVVSNNIRKSAKISILEKLWGGIGDDCNN